ncbi:MAG: hypothetical protein Q7V63_09475 [Gammaproteobacteria bacterium]|nr:hypothetical protein [Gammaproteobacteria bacterium]
MQTSLSLVPLWIYPLFFCLLIVGIRLCSPCTVKISRLAVLPLVFILLSAHHFLKLSNINVLNVLSWLIGIGFGSYIGYVYKHNFPIKIDRGQDLIYLPGDSMLLFLIFLDFGMEFFIAVIEGDGLAPICWWYHPLIMIVSGCIAGIVIGGNATHLYRYTHKKAESIGTTRA